MSYSRWSNSTWYTFWCSSDAENMEDEIFEVCGVQNFTYHLLIKDINWCLNEIKILTECTDEELEELRGYMIRFIKDVDEEYSQ